MIFDKPRRCLDSMFWMINSYVEYYKCLRRINSDVIMRQRYWTLHFELQRVYIEHLTCKEEIDRISLMHFRYVEMPNVQKRAKTNPSILLFENCDDELSYPGISTQPRPKRLVKFKAYLPIFDSDSSKCRKTYYSFFL